MLASLLLLCPCAAPQAVASPAGSALQRWTADFARGAPVDRSELDGLVSAARTEAQEPGTGHAAALALLDLAGIVRAESLPDLAEGIYRPDADIAAVRRVGMTALEALRAGPLGGELQDWLASSVLAHREHALPRRIAACELMRGSFRASTMLALFTCATGPERGLRDAAVSALAGWPDPSVHRFMAHQARRAIAEPGFVAEAGLRAHFAAVTFGAEDDFGRELAHALSLAAMSQDWRVALRAIRLLCALENELSIQPLIEALSVWIERGQRGAGSKRLEGELLAGLQRRSGKHIGPNPERWGRWWNTARGNAEAAEADEAAVQRTTAATFFGLRPATDRVLFVIDRSGSMDNPYGSGDRTRYREALDQMKGLLQELGPETKFSLMLFGSGTLRWSRDLRPATRSGLSAAVQWAIERIPAGGTQLRPAIEEAFELRRDGSVDLEQLEADTVIVLCDGATEEGPRWVAPLLARVNERACVVFHCVQIGPGGDGTLEALAAETGGDFLRVR